LLVQKVTKKDPGINYPLIPEGSLMKLLYYCRFGQWFTCTYYV